ncbi:hypothetical protein LXM25_23165 [Dyadobacter sp. LJ53]|uniref:hypothetical protein n=1 Tax=Dyadobacter chenwenxiniae TaxID=2906456 RepID=UPI001F45F204|nr:hypothetical protein [Dyadobacter chenwenxiniae]MCF0052988.1 hypothetical protein [Dyadobacter chenwenxiniae]
MRIVFLLLGSIVFSLSAFAQQQAPRWGFGIQGEYGRDWYHKEDAPSGSYEGSIIDFSSNRSWGAGFYFERSLNPRWSVLGQVGYAQKKVHPQLFHMYNQTTAHYLSEVHHRGAVDAGLRWYVNPQSKFRFFVDGKVGTNVFISAVRQENTHGRIVHSNVFGFQRVAPVASVSLGIKWSRLTISAEYRDDLSVSKRVGGMSEISGRGFVGKVAFALFRVKK